MPTTNNKFFAGLNNLLARLPSIGKTYEMQVDDFKKLFANLGSASLTKVMVRMPQGKTGYGRFPFMSNVSKIKTIVCCDKHGLMFELDNSPAVETKITFGNNKKTIYYFDSLHVDNGLLVGICSRLMTSLTQGIPLNEVTKVEIQAGFKSYNYYTDGMPMNSTAVMANRIKPRLWLFESILTLIIMVGVGLRISGFNLNQLILTGPMLFLMFIYIAMVSATPDKDVSKVDINFTKMSFFGCVVAVCGVLLSVSPNFLTLYALGLAIALLAIATGYFVMTTQSSYMKANKGVLIRSLIILILCLGLTLTPTNKLAEMHLVFHPQDR